MAIRITCPSCKAANTFNDEKRGQKVPCRKCKKPVAVPQASTKKKDAADEAIQEERKVRPKTMLASSTKSKTTLASNKKNKREEDEEDEADEARPTGKKASIPAKKKGKSPLHLILGGVAVFVLLCLVGMGAGAYYLINRARKAAEDVAKLVPAEKQEEDPNGIRKREEADPKEEKKDPTVKEEKKDPPIKEVKKDPSQLDRQPLDLTPNFTLPRERTVKVKITHRIALLKGDQKNLTAIKFDADILEVMNPDPEGSLIRTGFGALSITQPSAKKEEADLMRKVPPMFIVDNSGKLKRRPIRDLPATVDPELKEKIQDMNVQFASALEATLLPLPNRKMNPMETWTVVIPMPVREKERTIELNLNLTCTYEGIRENPRKEGVISVSGKVMSSDPAFTLLNGDVSGKFGFDPVGLYISSAKIKLRSEVDILAADLKEAYVFDIDLSRQSGNTMNIELPPDAKADPDAVVKFDPRPKIDFGPPRKKTLVSLADFLARTDPADPLAKGDDPHHMKTLPVLMKANNTYTIVLASAFNGHLRVLSPDDEQVANDGMGESVRLVYRPKETGVYTVVVTSNTAGATGQFQLFIQEAP